MESSSVTILRRRDVNHAEDTGSDSNTLCENRVTTEVRLVHNWTDMIRKKEKDRRQKKCS